MGKKYLETKKDSLESSILGVWQTAIEEGEAIKDAAQMTKEVTKEEVDLDEAFIAETKKEISELDALIKELDEGILGNIGKAAAKTVGQAAVGVAKKQAGKIVKKVSVATGIGKAFGKAKAGVKKAKELGGKIKQAAKTGTAVQTQKPVGSKFKKEDNTGISYQNEYVSMLEKLEVIESTLNDYCEVLEKAEASQTVKETNKNDKSDDGEGLDAVQPKALKKKFKNRKDKDIDNDGDVDDSDKFLHKRRKAVSKAIAKEEVDLDDNVEEYAQNAYFKIQSMKAALAKVWGMEEGKNPFAEHKGDKPHKHPHEEDEKEVVKDGKTETGKKAAVIDLKPKIKDQ